MRSRALLLVACLTSLVLPACSMTIGRLHPAPNIAIAPQQKTLRLVLPDAIRDRVAIPVGNGALTVEAWRETLGDFEPACARIQYKATLSGGGAVLKRTAGIAMKHAPAFAGGAAMASDLVAADVDGAVEAMYEQIAKELAAAG